MRGLERDGVGVSVNVSARIEVSSAEGLIASVREGLGIGVVSEWLCAQDLVAGTVVPLLSSFSIEAIAVHAVFPAGQRFSQKDRVFSDYLSDALAVDQPLVL